MKEDLGILEQSELVLIAKRLLDSTVSSAEALKEQPIDPERAKVLKLVLGFLNSYIKAFQERKGFIKLVGISEKLDVVKKMSKRLK